MPSFGPRSLANLETCHPDLQRLANRVILFYDFAVTCGHRTPEEQDILYAQGRTAPGDIVTWARGGESPHNFYPSEAFDFVPWPIDWKDEFRFIELGGAFTFAAFDLGIEIKWGGHFPRNKRDLPHIQRIRV